MVLESEIRELILGRCFSFRIVIFSNGLSRSEELSIIEAILLISLMIFHSDCINRNPIVFQVEKIQQVVLQAMTNEGPLVDLSQENSRNTNFNEYS